MDDLNEQQRIAASHIEGPMLVVAGAGSGKTRVVTHRIVHLLQMGVPAGEILAVTFTNKAAEEMRQRIQRLAQVNVLACTFHSLGARILRESINRLSYKPDFVIYDSEDSDKCLRGCLATLEQKEDKALFKEVRGAISNAKNEMISPEEFRHDDPLFGSAYRLYQQRLKEYNAVDFDDLLFLTVQLLTTVPDVREGYQKRWSFILIDEYQDTNKAQYLMIKQLSSHTQNIFAVGDPDQSIYSWRGANIQNILNFEKDYPGAQVVSLEQNYRSKMTILEAANALISHNTGRKDKELWSSLGAGEKIGLYICTSDHEEAVFVVQRLVRHHKLEGTPLKECVIFYRTNFQSRRFEDSLLRERIPYTIVGGLSFYQRREIKDILALLRLVMNGSDFLAFLRTINLPKRGLGEATIEKIRSFAEEQGVDIISGCERLLERQGGVKLSPKQTEGVADFLRTLFALREMVKADRPLPDLIEATIERSRYLEYLKEDPLSFEERRDNLYELITKAEEWHREMEFPTLAGFLEELSLKSSLDESDLAADSVRLMTLHHGKGLEFDVVFIVGLEEDLLPHVHSKENQSNLEEERRLCYVGMTRAKSHLYLTAVRERFLWGTPRLMRPSRFLKEIPQELLQAYHATLDDHSEEEETAFSQGDHVIHRDFGAGVVQKVYNTSLGTTYDIFFPQANTVRSLVARFAKLRKS
jgi:DNA helicase-2/ATP-dependent DNA helicase PcrA